MHQARTFPFPVVVSGALADALARFNTGINGDDRTDSNPTAPTDLLINSRLFKPLSLSGTQIALFHRHTTQIERRLGCW